MALTPVPVRAALVTVVVERPVIFGLTKMIFLECVDSCKPTPLISFLSILTAITTVSPSKNEQGNKAWSVSSSTLFNNPVQSIRQGRANAAPFRFGNTSKDTKRNSSKNVPAYGLRKNPSLICFFGVHERNKAENILMQHDAAHDWGVRIT